MTTARDDVTKDDRRWARRITLFLVVAPSLLAAPYFLNAVAHARADSEVGVMMYGFPLFIGMLYGAPVVGAFTLAWGLGLARARLRTTTPCDAAQLCVMRTIHSLNHIVWRGAAMR